MTSYEQRNAVNNALRNALLLYAVTDRRWLGGRALEDDVEAAIAGGATMVQLREKSMDDDAFFAEAIKIQRVCRKYSVPFIVNDNVSVAERLNEAGCGACGVHIGQSDMGIDDARRALGGEAIIGVSAQTVEEALYAESHGADYLGVGAVFPTGSKADAVEVPLEVLKSICTAVSIPVVAIGGITRDNVKSLRGSGICGVAVISALFAQSDIRQAASGLRAAVEGAGKPQVMNATLQ